VREILEHSQGDAFNRDGTGFSDVEGGSGQN
jgi:hypothetical protein